MAGRTATVIRRRDVQRLPTLRCRGERGTAMVELAIVIPVLVILLLGIVSGGAAYNQKLSLTNGAREGARYGATLPVGNSTLNAWLDNVAGVAQNAVDEGFGSGTPGRITCVAYVYPRGSNANDQTTRRRDVGGTVTYSTGSSATCYSDGRPDNERRVQVILQRDSRIDTGFAHIPLTLTGRSVARFERSTNG
jgi:Flp pilus assembly protein TadG